MPAIGVDTISGITSLDNTGHACIQTGGCCVLHGTFFCSYGMEYKKSVDSIWCQYPNPLTCGSLGVGVTCYNVTIPNLDTNTSYQYHAIACTVSVAISGTTLSIHTPISYPWITAPLQPGTVPLSGTCYNYTITGLSADTVYNYRSYMIVCGVEYYGNIYQIATTLSLTVPTISTGSAYLSTNPTTSIRVSGNTISNCGCPTTIIEYGIIYTQNPSRGNASTMCYENTPTCVCKKSLCDNACMNPYFVDNILYSIIGLSANTTTYYRAFAKNTFGNGYGNICCIQTAPQPPKQINLSCSACYQSPNLSYRVNCLTSTPAMVAGECYRACFYIDLCTFGQAAGSFSYVDIVCNGISQYCCCMVIPQPCQTASVSFPVKNTDTIMTYNCACVTNTSCPYSAKSVTCLTNVTSISGNFIQGTTCNCTCAYTG